MAPPEYPVPQAALAQFLDDCPNCVVLRNEEDLFENLQRGGDVDLLVTDSALVERTLIRHLGLPVRITRHSYVTEYYYDWGNIDVLPSVEWRGARYLQTGAVLDGARVSARGRPVPGVAHEALISWFSSLLWGGFFKERYASVICRAAEVDGVAFRQALVEAAGRKWGLHLWQMAADGRPETSANRAQRLRLAIWGRAWLKSPVPTSERALAFVVAELRLRFAPSVPWIAILGRDGGDQSAIVAEVADRLTACRYASVKAFHGRPHIVDGAQSAGPTTEPQTIPRRGPIGSGLEVVALSAGWLVGYWTRLVHLRAKGYVLLFDRMYFADPVIDARHRDGARSRLARAVSWLLPKPDLVFLLDSAAGASAQRERRLPSSPSPRQRSPDTASVRRRPTNLVLDGSLPLPVLADEIQRVIRAWMVDRSAVSAGGSQAPLPGPGASAGSGTGGSGLVEPRQQCELVGTR